jgi:hypothetical protein
VTWRLAAPSCVLPGTVLENCRFLAGRVDSVGLCLFESAPCLAYTDADLPLELASLPGRDGQPMRYHAHLPLDLPWHQGPEAVARVCIALATGLAHLRPEAFVLHPPADVDALERFLAIWQAGGQDPSLLCLENIADNDLAQTLPLTYAYNCGFCMDFGHALAYGQQWLLEHGDFLARTRMLHVYAPGARGAVPGHRHLPLPCLEPLDLVILERFLDAVSQARGTEAGLLVLELFSWSGIEESLDLVAPWLQPVGGA